MTNQTNKPAPALPNGLVVVDKGSAKRQVQVGDASRLVTMEIPTDASGRPSGPPRPYEYSCDNGKTVKERWL